MSWLNKSSTKLIFSVALLMGLGWYFFNQKGIQLDDVSVFLRRFGVGTLMLAGFLVALQNVFMALRVWSLFPTSQRIPLKSAFHGVFYGQAVNTFVPARAGDVLKAVIFSRSGNTQITTTAGVIVADKFIDLVALLLLIFFSGSFFVIKDQWSSPLELRTAVFFGLGVVFLFFLIRVFLKSHLEKLLAWWNGFKGGLSGILNWKRALPALLIGVSAWSCEALAVQALCKAQDFSITFSQVVFLLAILNVAIAVPISLANLGPFEAALVFGMSKLGAPSAMAIALAAACHALQMGTILLLSGIIALMRLFPFASSDAATEFRVRDSDKRKAKDYFEKISQNYDEKVNRGFLSFFRTRERSAVLGLSDLDHPKLTLIDVGCGAGFYSLEAKKKGLIVHSVDMSPQMVKKLESHVDKVHVFDIESIPTDQKFDRVICAGVLDFVKDPELAFSNLCQLVAPGGKLVVLCPRQGLGGFYYRCEKYFVGMQVNLFNSDWLSSLALKHGLKLAQITYPLPTNMAILFTRAN